MRCGAAMSGMAFEWNAGAVAPAFPGAVEAFGSLSLRLAVEDLLDLAGRQEIDLLTETQRVHLQMRVHLEVDRNIDRLAQAPPGHHRAVAPHQRTLARTHRLGQIASLRHVGDQHVGVAEIRARLPYAELGPDRRALVHRRPALFSRHAKGYDAGETAVHHAVHVGALLDERAMDESFVIRPPAACLERLALQGEFP